MKSELEKLREQLEKAQKKLAALQEEKADMDNFINNGGELSDIVANYYDEICKLIYAAENVVGNIENQIKDIEENSTYRLLGENIPENKQEIYDINGARAKIRYAAQKAAQKGPKQISEEPIIDVNLEAEDLKDAQNDTENKNNKKMTALKAGAAALLVGIGAVTAKLCEEVKKSNNQDNTTMEQPVTPDTDSNIAYDYEENVVTITPEPTATPEPTPSDPYMNVADYNEAYRAEYEELRELYNLTYADVVDYVNRAHSIQSFNFFPEASIDDVARLLMNIDNKKLFTNNDDNLSTLLTTVIAQVAENATWGQPIQEDINKMNALQYFAKDGSDLDEFLTELGEINKRVLSDPNNAEEKYNAYLYLRTFIHSFNSYDDMTNYINEYPETDYGQELASDLANGEILTDEVLKEKAMVKDSYDWYFSYNLTSAFASIYAPIDYNEAEFAKWDELWMMGETALESPEIQEICNNGLGLSLGGE